MCVVFWEALFKQKQNEAHSKQGHESKQRPLAHTRLHSEYEACYILFHFPLHS